MSFDVASLFMNVPICAIYICKQLQEDNNLKERTVLLPDSITELLKHCLKSNFVCYREAGSMNIKRELQWVHLCSKPIIMWNILNT